MIAQQNFKNMASMDNLNRQIINLDACINQKIKQLDRLKSISRSIEPSEVFISMRIIILEREIDEDIDRLIDIKREAHINGIV